MKALSIKNPWASLIAAGLKPREIRSWRTHYRGPVLVCSSLKPDNSMVETIVCPGSDDGNRKIKTLNMWEPPEFDWCSGDDWDTCCECRKQWIDTLPLGQALAVANLADCRPMTKEDEASAWVPFKEGLWAWVLEDVKLIKPFPVKGRLGLWNYQGECWSCPKTDDICWGQGGGCPDWELAESLFLSQESAVGHDD